MSSYPQKPGHDPFMPTGSSDQFSSRSAPKTSEKNIFKAVIRAIRHFFTDPITQPAPIVYLGFFACILVTAVLFSYSSYYEFLHEKEEFSSTLQEFNLELKERRAAYLGLLKGEMALFLFGGQNLTSDKWRQYIENVLDDRIHSGLSAFAYVEAVQHKEELSALKKEDKDTPQKLVLHPQKNLHAITRFTYDVSQKSDTFSRLNFHEGVDLFTNPLYEEALMQAKDTRLPVGVKLDFAKKPASAEISQLFLVILPVFQKQSFSKQTEENFIGWVLGVVDVGRFFAGILPDTLMAQVSDGTNIVFSNLIETDSLTLKESREVDVLSNKWNLIVSPKTFEKHLFYKISSWLIPIIGFMLSIAVSIVLWSQTTTRRRAQAMADKISHDLRVSEYKNRTIIENVPGAIFRSTSLINWQMEFMSDAIKEMSGYPSSDFTQNKRNLSDILFEEDINAVEQAVGFKPKQGHTYDVEYRIHHADGHLRWLSERGRVISNDETGEAYLMGTIFDVTDRKNKESDLRSLTTALQNAVEGIAFVNAAFEVERVNGAYLAIFQTKEELLLGTDWLDGILPEDRKKATSIIDTDSKERFSFQVRANRSDGSIIHIHCVFVPSVDSEGSIEGYYCFVRDVTERIQKEEALAFAVEEAKKANHTKSEFLATMSHELRTPLNAIIGYSEILMEEAEEESLETMSGDLKKINTAGRHLLELINDILDVSKLEAGKMTIHLEKFDIYTMVKNIQDLMMPTVSKNHNDLVLDCQEDMGEMYSDYTKVRQALFNLVSNAAKFTTKGTIKIRVREQKKNRKDYIVFDVEDSGCGISEEQLAKLFQPFTQADSSTTRKYGGTGLGLTITKRFCTMLEGNVTVTSDYGQGSTFSILLPRITRPGLVEKLEKKQKDKKPPERQAV